jgi:hypothetical protein
MKDPRMKGVESSQPGFKALKKSASRKSERRSTRKAGKRHHSKY